MINSKKREVPQEKQHQQEQEDQQQQRIIVGDEKIIRPTERRAEITAALTKKYEGKTREVSENLNYLIVFII